MGNAERHRAVVIADAAIARVRSSDLISYGDSIDGKARGNRSFSISRCRSAGVGGSGPEIPSMRSRAEMMA